MKNAPNAVKSPVLGTLTEGSLRGKTEGHTLAGRCHVFYEPQKNYQCAVFYFHLGFDSFKQNKACEFSTSREDEIGAESGSAFVMERTALTTQGPLSPPEARCPPPSLPGAVMRVGGHCGGGAWWQGRCAEQ